MDLLEALLRTRQVCVWPQLYFDGMALKGDEHKKWTGRSKKMETLVEMLKEHPKEKSLIFCQFTEEMDHLQVLLGSLDRKIFRLDGSVPDDHRTARRNEFQLPDANIGAIFLIQIKAGGVGLNLQQATRVYITAPHWNPATEIQAIGRAHRTGQTQKVTVRKLIYKGDEEYPSVEESIMVLQETKSKVCAEVLNDTRLRDQVPTIKKVGLQTIRKIFSV
jgi:SNF2 family DNA or RNA helicase